MKLRAATAAAVVTLLLGSGGRVEAALIISNLTGNDGTSTFINAPLGGSDGGGAFDSKAAGFTIPLGFDYTLDSVQLRLNFFNLQSVPRIAIYNTNASGNPGALLTTLTNPAFAVGTNTYTFTPPASLTLNAGATYWIVATNQAAVANSYQWMASLPGVTPTGIATSAGYRFDFGIVPPVTPSTTFNSYAVNATPVTTAVPEPASIALLIVGGAGLAGCAWRRRRRAA